MNVWNWVWRWLLGIFIFGLVIVWVIGVGVRVAGIDDARGAQVSQVCDALDSGKINTTGDPLTVTITAPAGQVIDGYCVKAGSASSGDGPVHVTVNPPQTSVTFGYPSGKAVSHYSYSYIGIEEPTTTTTVPPTTTTTPATTTTTFPTITTPPPSVAPPTTVTDTVPIPKGVDTGRAPEGGVAAGGGACVEGACEQGRPLAEWLFIVIGVLFVIGLITTAVAVYAFDRGWLVRPGVWR